MKNIFLFIAFIIFLPFFYLIILGKKIWAKENGWRILVINNAKIGDLVCVTPVFRAIKEEYPESYLGVFVTHKTVGILKNNKRIDKLFVYYGKKGKTWQLLKEIKKGNFNVVITMVPGTLGLLIPFFCFIPIRIANIIGQPAWLYQFFYLFFNHKINFIKNTSTIKSHLKLLEPIGIHNQNVKKEIFIDEQSKIKAEKFLLANNIKKDDIVVGLSLTAGNKIKEWEVEKFSELADLIADRFQYKVMAIGAPSDKELLERFQGLAKKSALITYNDFFLQEIPALINRFDYFISGETGPLHIANALGIPVLDILGPCTPYDQPPIYDKCEIIHAKNLDCWPCTDYVKVEVICRHGHNKCVKSISVSQVMEVFETLMGKYKKW